MKDLSEIEKITAELRELESRKAYLIPKRDKMIAVARVDGWDWSLIEHAAQLSRMGVTKAASRGNGGELPKSPKRK